MVIGSRPNFKKISDKNVQSHTFVNDDTQIGLVEKAKYLGVQIDQHLFEMSMLGFCEPKHFML